MKRLRFSDEQIIGILNKHQAGPSATELCRKYGVSDATFYKWRSKYGGMDVSEAKRLKALEEENGKLKRLLADAMLDVSTLREMLGKTSDAWVEEDRRDLGDREQGLYAASCLRAGRHGAAGLPILRPLAATGRSPRGACDSRSDLWPFYGRYRHPEARLGQGPPGSAKRMTG